MYKGLANHPETYYAATSSVPPATLPLAGAVEADVCVIGGGLAGLSSALHLAERGYRVALIEEHRLGWGASGRNGGQALPGVACGQTKLESLLGRSGGRGDAHAGDARAAWDITVQGLALIRDRIARHAIDCDWQPGHLQVADKPRQVAELEHEQAQLHALGYPATQLLDAHQLTTVLATDRYLAGLYDAHAGHLHPLRYTLGLARAALQAGVITYEGTRATGYSVTASGVRVRTLVSQAADSGAGAGAGAGAGTSGEVRCQHLLLAGNTQLGAVAPALARKIIPVGTYIVATERLSEARARSLITNNAAVADLNWIIDYYRRSADHRLLFGGRVSYSGLENFEAVPVTRARMLRVFPQLHDVRIDYHWGGLLDITLNRAPHFGRLEPNVWFLQGFSGHGLSLTGMAGCLAAEAIAGVSERFDVFARIPHRDFPGGTLLRRPALILAMLWYRLRDRL